MALTHSQVIEILRECYMFRSNVALWKRYYGRKPEHIAIESLSGWSYRFEILGVQFEPPEGMEVDWTWLA